MTLAPCPNCGGKTTADQDRFYGGTVRWVVSCDEPNDTRSLPNCGYRGPFGLTLEEAVRKHNHISQKCGAV